MKNDNGQASARWRSLPVLLIAAGVTGWVLWESQRVVRADFLSMRASRQVAEWVSGAVPPPSTQDWQQAQAALQAALAITPENAALHEQLADLHAVAGRRDWKDETLRAAHFRAAVAVYRMALERRPTDPRTWASLAAAYQGMGETGEPMRKAWDRALELGPNESHVQPMLLEIALATWASAPPHVQRWAEAFFAGSAEGQRKAINNLAARYGLAFEVDPVSANEKTGLKP